MGDGSISESSGEFVSEEEWSGVLKGFKGRSGRLTEKEKAEQARLEGLERLKARASRAESHCGLPASGSSSHVPVS